MSANTSPNKSFYRSLDDPNGPGWKLPPFATLGDSWITPKNPDEAKSFAEDVERNVANAYGSIRWPFGFSRMKAVETVMSERGLPAGTKIFSAKSDGGWTYEATVAVFSTENGTAAETRKIRGIVSSSSSKDGSEVSLFFKLADGTTLKWTADSYAWTDGAFHAFSKIRKLKDSKKKGTNG